MFVLIFTKLRGSRLGILIRNIISEWPAYQTMPGVIHFQILKLKMRVMLSFISETLTMSQVIRRKLQSTKKLQGVFDGEILILGNGPSINNLDLEQIEAFQKFGGKVAVMNNFLLTKKKNIEPDFIFMTYPGYWDLNRQESESRGLDANIRHLREFQKCFLVQPAKYSNILEEESRTIFVDHRSIAGLCWVDSPVRPQASPSSVALTALSTAKYLGFQRIYFAGLDSDMYKRFFVDMLNEIYFDTSENYFYSTETKKMDDLSEKSGFGVISMEGLPVSSMSDALFAAAVFLRDFKRMNDGRFINVGGDFTNDAAPRACLTRYY